MGGIIKFPNYIKQILHTQIFSVINIIIGLASLLFLTKYMQIKQYGEYILIQGAISLGGLIFSQNLYSYSRLKIPGVNKEIQYGYLKTVITIVLFVYIFILLLLKLFNLDVFLFNFLDIDTSFFYFVIIMLAFRLLNTELARFYISVKRVQLNNYSSSFQKIFMFLAVLLLFIFNNLNLYNFLYFYIFGQFIIFIYLIYFIDLKLMFKASFMKDVLRNGYKIGIPLLPIGLMSIALNYTDTIMISKFIDKAHVAQYGFSSQIIMIIMMLIGSVILILFPYATEANNNNDYKTKTLFFIKMYVFGALLALSFYMLSLVNSYWVINVLNLVKYRDVSRYLIVLGIFPFVHLLYSISSHNLQLLKIFNIQMIVAIIVIIENFILNYFMIQKYQVMGATYASLMSYFTLFIVYSVISFKNDLNLRNSLKAFINIFFVIISFVMIFSYLFIDYSLYKNSFYVIIGNIFISIFIGIYFLYFKRRIFL